MIKVRLDIQGATPLLMHNVRLSDPLDYYARELKKLSAKRTKTDDDHMEMGRIEFLGGMYHDAELGPYIPGTNLHAALIQGAKGSRRGEHVKRGVLVTEVMLPLVYDGPRDPHKLWEDKNFRARHSVGVTKSRVMRTRPMFHVWSLSATLMVEEGQLDFDGIKEIADYAGRFAGLGDYRPTYGRFTVESTLLES